MDVLGRIKYLLELRKWSYYRLAKEMNRPVNTISDMYKRNSIPSIPTLEAICDAFGITLSEFFAVEDDPYILNPRQKKLLDIYNILDIQEKDLADAYILGLSRRPLSNLNSKIDANDKE